MFSFLFFFFFFLFFDYSFCILLYIYLYMIDVTGKGHVHAVIIRTGPSLDLLLPGVHGMRWLCMRGEGDSGRTTWMHRLILELPP